MKQMLKAILALALLLSLLLPAGTALADGEGWYIVQSTSPNGYAYLYSAASDRDGVSINKGRYDNGELVYVLDYYGGQDGKYNYCRVQTQDDKTGYMHDYALSRYYAADRAQGDPGWYMVQSTMPDGYAYLYSNPTDRSEVSINKGRYDNGELVYVLDFHGGQEGKYNYCHVQTQDGKTGYMHDYALVLYLYDGYLPGPDSEWEEPEYVTPGSSLSALPSLTFQCRGTVRGSDTNVYTGPSAGYYRTSSGNAYVALGESLNIYGREGNYYLVQYSGRDDGQTVSRCSFIQTSRLTPNGSVAALEFAWLPIRISYGAHMADAPDWYHSFNAIDIDCSNAYALAKVVDGAGTVWVYFESTGYASTSTQTGTVSVRGFVPMADVSLR